MFNTISKDLLLSARADNNLAIKRILKNTTNIIDPNLQDETGKTALHWAVVNLNLFIVRAILENKNDNIVKSNINIQNNKGYTALHHAIFKHNFYFIEELLDNKANPFIINKYGFSVLDNLNRTEFNLKSAIIESLYSKYPRLIEWSEDSKLISKIIIYDLKLFYKLPNNTTFNDTILLDNNETLENIENDA